MRIMKLKACCALIGASLFTTPALFAQIVTTGNIGTGSLLITAPNYSTHGDQAGPYLIQNLTVATGVNPASTFQTFCIGSQVNFYPGSTYNYQISDTVQPASGVGSPGYVTWGTAYLYSQFLTGALGFGGNTTTPASTSAALQLNDALQVAIWTLQGQSLSGIAFSGSVNTSDVNAFLADALNAASTAGVSDGSDANGAFGIYALNMYSGDTYAQPELVQVPGTRLPPTPVPEPGTVFAGAFAGLMLLAPIGRNMLGKMRKQRAV
jgi:hypothetical protein